MVLHEEFVDDLTNEEIKRIVTDFVLYRLNCNIDFDNLAEEIINLCEKRDEINDDDKFRKFIKLAYKHYERNQERKIEPYTRLVDECLANGESRLFSFAQTRNADYILEINLIESKDVPAQDYYKDK